VFADYGTLDISLRFQIGEISGPILPLALFGVDPTIRLHVFRVFDIRGFSMLEAISGRMPGYMMVGSTSDNPFKYSYY
jgi:hypothetical protein